jgi:hypothetical protein
MVGVLLWLNIQIKGLALAVTQGEFFIEEPPFLILIFLKHLNLNMEIYVKFKDDAASQL